MKKQASIILAALLAVSLTACSGGKTETPATTAAGETSAATEAASTAGGDNTAVSPDNDCVIALQADATHLDPHVSGNGVSNTITNSMYETLVWFDENLELKPLLAKSWTVSDDGLDYTFVLNEGIKFHDGEPFNAESIVANYERAKSDSSLRLASQTAMWDSVTVDSEYQVTIHLKEPNNTFLNKLAQVRIVSPKAIKELGKDGLAKQSAGTGPFILSERVDGGYTKMVRNENYWQDGPKVDTLTWRVVPEDGARVAMLQTGEADIISPLPAIQVDKLKDDASLDVLNLGGLTYRYATLNKNYTLADGRKPLDDVRVRQAMNYAFDSEAYTQVVFQGYASVPTSLFASSVPYYAEQTPYTADVEKAKSLMSEAGYSDGFPINIWVDNTTIEMQGAEFLKQQLAQINIDVNVVPMESTTIADMTSAPEDKTEVQMWYVNWGSGSYEADGSMRNILHGDKMPPEGYNTAFWNNEEFNELLDSALKMTATEEIAEAYAKAQAIAWEECPWIFLGNNNTLTAHKSYVSGIKYKPAGELIFQTISMDH